MRLHAAPLRETSPPIRLAFVLTGTILEFPGADLSAGGSNGWIPDLRESEWTSR